MVMIVRTLQQGCLSHQVIAAAHGGVSMHHFGEVLMTYNHTHRQLHSASSASLVCAEAHEQSPVVSACTVHSVKVAM